MTDREIITKLRALSGLRTGGDPDPRWREVLRAELLGKIAPEFQAAPASRGFAFVVREWLRVLSPGSASRLLLRPTLAAFAAFGIVLGGWVTTVSASYGALPGDRLYGVKLAAERAQTTLAGKEVDRAKLRMEFIARRVDEVVKIS